MVTDAYQARGTQVRDITRPDFEGRASIARETASSSFFTFTAPERHVRTRDTRAERLPTRVLFPSRASPSTAVLMIGPQT